MKINFLINSYSYNTKTDFTEKSQPPYRNCKQLLYDQVCFKSAYVINNDTTRDVLFSDISKLPQAKLCKILMKFNKPDGPLVGYLAEHYSSIFPEIPAEKFKEWLSRAYKEQAKAIASIAKNNPKTKVLIARKGDTKEIAGIIAVLPVGRTINNTSDNIYEICNFGVVQKHQIGGLGNKILSKALNSIQDPKAIIFAKVTNPVSRKLFEKNEFESNIELSKYFKKPLGDDYSKNKFLFKTINIDQEDLTTFTLENSIGEAWKKGWPERDSFDN